ncbi:hypothetical protein ACFQZT_26875 [Paenibacillus sp. GCM10027628]|uniref:hypothetical protein n=1 Tax=Paenibacillus sp. GCM10027628 TaxID=3273413 RepID=UPI003629CAE9
MRLLSGDKRIVLSIRGTVTATFIIDKEGIIRRAYVNPDFMKRMEPQEIIDQLKKL